MDLSLYTELSPYFALLKGKDEQQEEQLLGRIVALSENTRGFLADEATAQRVVDIVKEAGADAKFGVAVAKLIGLRILGDVKAPFVSTLLERVGLPGAQAQVIASKIESLIAAIPQASPEELPARQSTPQQAPAPAARPSMDATRPPTSYTPIDMSARRLPPLTQQIPEADSAPVPQRNIIDLRKPPNPTT